MFQATSAITIPVSYSGEHFALPSEEITQIHYHDSVELGICLQGNGYFISLDRIEPIGQGDAILIAPGVRHYSKSLDRCRCLFLFVDLGGLFRTLGLTDELLFAMTRECFMLEMPMILRSGDYPELNEMIQRVIIGYDTDWKANGSRKFVVMEDEYSASVLNAGKLLAARMTELLLLCRERFRQRTRVVPEHDVLIPAVEYISLHYERRIRVDELAEMCHISRSTLRREFLQAYQMTPYAYLTQFRCRTAGMLLDHTSLPVGEIASQVGYRDFADFYRNFLTYHGMPPSEYRKRHKSDASRK